MDGTQPSTDTSARGPVAAGTVVAYYGVNAVQRTNDTVRSIAAVPYARENGKLARLTWEGFIVGRPSSAVVPLTGGPNGYWRRSFRFANGLNAAIGPLSAAVGLSNLAVAVHRYGPEGMVDSKAGRTGVLQSTAAAAAVAATMLAAGRGRGSGARAVVRSAWTDPLLASPILTAVTAGTGGLTLANELGYLRVMDRGNELSLGASLGVATEELRGRVADGLDTITPG